MKNRWCAEITTFEKNGGPLIEFVAGTRQAREQFQRQAIAAIHSFAEQAISTPSQPEGGFR